MNIRAMNKADFDYLLGVLDAWWGGRPIHHLLHPVYLYQFGDTAFVVEENTQVTGFLVGFVAQTMTGEAYVHLVGTAPAARKHGVARSLYERFFSVAQSRGCRCVKAITVPTNQVSIDFHQQMGFRSALVEDYSGPGQDRVVFVRQLPSS
jgi:predicted GNAT superfamily acetyltransferase